MKLTHSLGAKITAIFLFALFSFAVIAGVCLTGMMAGQGYYWDEGELREDTARNAQGEALLYRERTAIPVLTVIAFLLCTALLLFLLCGAGRRAGREEAVLNLQDKVPFDLYALAAFLLGCLAVNAACDVIAWDGIPSLLVDGHGSAAYLMEWILFALSVEAAVLIVLASCMTLSTRIKTGTLWRNTVTYRLLRLCWRAVRWMGRGVRTLCRNLPLLWKGILGYSVYSLVMLLVCRETYYSGMAALFWIGLNMTILLVLCFFILQIAQLKEGAKRLAEGDLSYHVPTERMFFELKRHGENLNSIGEGMTRAVEERMKSERLKTELITNVSHDIKTPLTSILNYVDLLKKEPAASDAAGEYIAVLDRQAHRLKKLTEDVLEASKAATGNIKVELARTDAVELLGQCLAEYEERFQRAGLVVVMQTPGGSASILADGRLLWRVFDNLLGNIAKYGQPGTRVYAGVTQEGADVAIALKNVSRDPLNISEEELMERFVRGDSARTSEGSGLGLSIARSLTELQGGRFGISIDCDLFKAELRFAAAEG